MPLESRDLTNVLRGRVEEDAARTYHMQMLEALKEASPLSPSYEELRDEIFATAYEDEPKSIASGRARGDAWARHTKRRW